MKNSIILTGTLLLLPFISYGLDPPVMLWEKWYYTDYDYAHFRDIELTPSGNLVITGLIYDYTPPPYLENWIAIILDQEGEILLEIPHEFAGASGWDCEVLSDGSFIVTGGATPDTNSTSSGLCIHKISADGTTEWAKVYDYLDTTETGYSITCLPDGGFAVCGRVHGTGTINAGQMWLLRTDAYGDTLWTREWGSTVANSPDWGKTVLFSNDELCVLAHGLTDSLPTYGPHLLFYDLDGNYQRGTDYPDLYWHFPRGMCIASDGGYTFVTDENPVLWHTDQYGATLWGFTIPQYGIEEGYDVVRTMDSGYIFCGWGGFWGYPPSVTGIDCMQAPVIEVDTGSTQDGWLVKFDVDGNPQWGILNETGHDNHYYSVVQLPQGGYIACGTWGGSGYIARYSPETGISSPDPVSSLSLEVSPNPFSSILSASLNLPEESQATLTVYDLCGRTVGETTSGSYPGGTSTIEWAAPSDLGSGCYFVRLNTSGESVTRSCVFIR